MRGFLAVLLALLAPSFAWSQVAVPQQLTWVDASTNEDRFEIERRADAGSYLLLATVGPDTQTYTTAQLVPGTLYTYRLRACNIVGCSDYSNEASAIAVAGAPPTEAPSAPQMSWIQTGQQVVSLTLINADTDQPIAEYNPLVSGVTLNLATLPTRKLNIEAFTSPAVVGSVKFVMGATTKIENNAVYAMWGNTGSDYTAWTPPLGNHTLTVTPYTSTGGSGTAGTALTILFSVIDQAAGGGGSEYPPNFTGPFPTDADLAYFAGDG